MPVCCGVRAQVMALKLVYLAAEQTLRLTDWFVDVYESF
jgi:hypothetical protein